jgi:hypothetical protein
VAANRTATIHKESYTVQLREVAGTVTTLTNFTIDGTDYSSSIAAFFRHRGHPCERDTFGEPGGAGAQPARDACFLVQWTRCNRTHLDPAGNRPVPGRRDVTRSSIGRSHCVYLEESGERLRSSSGVSVRRRYAADADRKRSGRPVILVVGGVSSSPLTLLSSNVRWHDCLD